ncbi:MAG TPA: LemA family protein [Candidatus Thermoplasmatota archaeon]|nr:LemA family protein [Candidatus Thermoplasmatota archaeon]
MAKGTWIALGVLGGILLLAVGVVGSAIGTYNELNRENVAVDQQAKQVDVTYQKAFALLPSIERLATTYLQNESDIQTRIAALRTGLAPAQGGNETQKDDYVRALGEVTDLIVIAGRTEAYPELRSIDLYQTVITERINVENQILGEKTRYNDRVAKLNAHLKECCLPLIVGRLAGFEAREFKGYSDSPNQEPFPVGQTY